MDHLPTLAQDDCIRCILTCFAGANTNCVGYIAHEDFAITDLARLRRFA